MGNVHVYYGPWHNPPPRLDYGAAGELHFALQLNCGEDGLVSKAVTD